MLVVALATICLADGVSFEQYQVSNECPRVWNGTVINIIHETDCTKYYSCINGRKYLHQCKSYAPGQYLHYDPRTNRCEWPWYAQCGSKVPTCAQYGYREIYPYNCTQYYECRNGQRVKLSCSNGEVFDSDSKMCLPSEQAICTVYKNTCPTGKLLQTVYLPHECSCDFYYQCVDGEYVERACPHGESFDINRRACVSSTIAVCDPDSNNGVLPDVECPLNGTKRIPHETDCGSYYLCVDGVKNKKYCEDGLSFDATKGMCTWPLSGSCSSKSHRKPSAFPLSNANEEIAPREDRIKCPSEQTDEIVRLPHHCSASKFYVCEQGRMYLHECPDGLLYDNRRQTCSDANGVTTKDQKPGSVLNAKAGYAQCPRIGHTLIPHEANCSLYYVCDNGRRSKTQSCYTGHYFNPEISSCDLPENTLCFTAEVTTLSTSTSVSPGSRCSMTETKCKLIPDPCNCQQYTACENGVVVSRTCPSNLHFDNERQTCNLPENAHCTANCSVCIEGELIPHECQCQEYYLCSGGRLRLETCPDGMLFDDKLLKCLPETSHVHCKGDKDDDDDGCIGSCTTIDYLSHKDCRKYCICENGINEIEECPAPTVFNPDRKISDWPENVRNLSCDPFPCIASDDAIHLPHECNCSMYYTCVNGFKYREYCKEGFQFDYEKQTCVLENAHCYHDKESKDVKECKETCRNINNSTVLIPHTNCTKYCMCVNNVRHVYTCPEDQYFDESRRICDWYENIKSLSCKPYECNNNDLVPHECNCSIYYECNGTDKIRATCENGMNYDYLLQQCVKVDPHCMRQYIEGNGVETDRCIGTCPASDSASLKHLPHENCSRYCVCKSGRPFIVDCADNLRYDRYLQICTSPENANCYTKADT